MSQYRTRDPREAWSSDKNGKEIEKEQKVEKQNEDERSDGNKMFNIKIKKKKKINPESSTRLS